jgi:hypothetical protein
MGRPENNPNETMFLQKLGECSKGINLELEIQVLVFMRFFKKRSNHLPEE